MNRAHLLRIYLTLVSAAGLLAAAMCVVVAPPELDGKELGWLGLLFVGMLVGELFPIRVYGEEGEETVSTPFGFAILLLLGPVMVIAAQLLASAIADVANRRPIDRIVFNLGQLSLAWLAAAGVLAIASVDPAQGFSFHLVDLVAVVAAAMTFFVVNSTFVRAAEALYLRLPIKIHLRQDFAHRAWIAGLLFASGPPIAVLIDAEPLLIPLIVLPMAAIHRSSRQASEMEALALHDSLTGLANRAKFTTYAGEAIERALRHRELAAILMMDLDRFKEINDTLGHRHGDGLLKSVAERLRSIGADVESVSRFGGDEFAAVVVQPDHESIRTQAAAFRDALDAPIVVDGVSISVGASIGIAVAPDNGTTVDDLLQYADSAMYRAKAEHSPFEFYVAEEDDRSRFELSLVNDLKNALNAGELDLVFQPKIGLADDSVQGVEALARWHHPEHGPISPTVFIPMAENTGQIRQVTRLVLRMALMQQSEWLARRISIPMAVNISVQNLMDGELPRIVGELLDEFALDPSLLEIEVTESTLMADPERARSILGAIHDLGVTIAIDDFGTGYSSLAYITDLPVDTIKIDKSFVMRFEHDRSAAIVVNSIIDLARNLGLKTVAEGIEDDRVKRTLASLGCTYGQGFGICRPRSAVALQEWLAERESLVVLSPPRPRAPQPSEERATVGADELRAPLVHS